MKVFVDSGEYDPWDLSPLHTEVKELGACDYRSNCERYAVLRFRSIDELIVSMSHERKLFEEKLEQLKAYKTVQIIVEADYEKFATGKYDRDMLLKAAKQQLPVGRYSMMYMSILWVTDNLLKMRPTDFSTTVTVRI